MGIKESREALIATAAGWDGVADEFNRARDEMVKGLGRGSEFGLLATSAGIGTQHDKFIRDVVDALGVGRKTMRSIADALVATAEDFGATDTDVADTFHNPDGTPR